MATTLTATDCREIMACLQQHETPARAAHDCSIQLQAIRPYYDRRLERTRDVLRMLDTLTPERLASRLALIQEWATR